MSSYSSPVLDRHRVGLDPVRGDESPSTLFGPDEGPHLFDLNTGHAISISDQMSLGHEFAREALRAGVIGEQRPMLVIGAGVAGMMAAMTAVHDGSVPTVVVEKCRILSVQGHCMTRYVCPTQYSWPDPRWQDGVYPNDGRKMLFDWRRGYAGVFAAGLHKFVADFLYDYDDLLRVVTGRYVGYRLWRYSRLVEPLFRMEDGGVREIDGLGAFPVAVSCAGFGVEVTEVPRFARAPTEGRCLGQIEDDGTNGAGAPRYTGFKFWQRDKYDRREANLGIAPPAKPSVLISGNGDGALQDFLRVVTRHASAGELYALVRRRLPRRVVRRVEAEIDEAEKGFRRALPHAARYRGEPRYDMYRCWVHATVHRRHLGLVLELCRDPQAWHAIVGALDESVKDLRDEIRVKLVHPCVHFNAYYGLNRFLVLLIAAYVYQKYPDVEVFHPDTVVNEVLSAEEESGERHVCYSAWDCHGRPHEVQAVSPVYCSTLRGVEQSDPRRRPFRGGPFNALVVRHGIYSSERRLLHGRPLATA